MKNVLLLSFIACCLWTTNVNAQWINSLTVVPANPTPSDTVLLIADCSFPSGSCDQHTQGFNISGTTITAWALHCVGVLAVICNHSDTFALGTLSPGTYVATFQLDHGLLPSPCTAGIVPGPSNSLSFNVSLTTDIPAVNKEKEWATISPNPSSGELHITLNSSMDSYGKSLLLYDIYGNKIWESKIVSQHQNILIESPYLSPGIYLLKMGTHSQKLVIDDH